MKLIILTITLLLMSCSTVGARKWKPCGVSIEKKTWRFCDEKDQDKNLKGMCYWDVECKKVIFRTKKRRSHLFCSWGDISCMRKYKLLDKKIR